MLDKEANLNVQNIQKVAKEIWGNKVSYGSFIDYKDLPARFEWIIYIGRWNEIRLFYERSCINILVNQPHGFTYLQYLTKTKLPDSKQCSIDSLRITFKALDKVLQKIDKKRISNEYYKLIFVGDFDEKELGVQKDIDSVKTKAESKKRKKRSFISRLFDNLLYQVKKFFFR